MERLEDRPLLIGRGRYVDDLPAVNAVVMRLVRSPVAFGRVLDIDVDDAFAMPGVVAILTADDLDPIPPLPIAVSGDADPADLEPYRQPLLAGAMVRFAGEPVVAVFAETAAQADDAAERVRLSVDPREASTAFQSDTRPFSEDLRAAEAARVETGHGDLNRAFHEADRIVAIEARLERDAPMPLEPRAALALYDPARDHLTLHAPLATVHDARETLADMLSRARESLAVVCPDVGGRFGAKTALSPEDVLVCHAARLFERPVRYVEDRRETMLAGPHGRGLWARARAAVRADGTVGAIDVTFAIDQGAFLRPEGTLPAEAMALALPGPYGFDAFRATGHLRITHKVPAGLMRGAGRAEAAFVRERLMDAVADDLGEDRVALRRRHLRDSPAPHLPAFGTTYAAPASPVASLLDRVERQFALDVMRRRLAERRAGGALSGLGCALAADPTPLGGPERVTIRVDRHGKVAVFAAAAPAGQGLHTMIRQIVCDILAVEPGDVRLVLGRTDTAAFSEGSLWPRGTCQFGTAAQLAAEQLRERALRTAARLTRIDTGTLTIQAGRVREADRHFGPTVSLGEIARALEPGGAFADQSLDGLTAAGTASAGGWSGGHCVCIALADVDAATGFVRVPRLIVAQEVGNLINPADAEGQVVGGVLIGLSSALFTALRHDPSGNPVDVSFANYPMPTAMEAPAVDVLFTEDQPDAALPLGLRSCGTTATAIVGAAVAAAVDHALSAPGFAATLPIDPAAIRALLRARGER